MLHSYEAHSKSSKNMYSSWRLHERLLCMSLISIKSTLLIHNQNDVKIGVYKENRFYFVHLLSLLLLHLMFPKIGLFCENLIVMHKSCHSFGLYYESKVL